MFGFAFIFGLFSILCQYRLNMYPDWQKRSTKQVSQAAKPNNQMELLDKGEDQSTNQELEYSDFITAFKRHKKVISKAFISNILDYKVVPAIMFSLIVRSII